MCAFHRASQGRQWRTGETGCCSSGSRWQGGGQGSLATVTPLLSVCAWYLALIIGVLHAPAGQRESSWDSKTATRTALRRPLWAQFRIPVVPTSFQTTLFQHLLAILFFWETHLHQRYCCFRYRDANHSWAFLGRRDLCGLQLPELCKQPLFKISLEYVLQRETKTLRGNWTLKLS